MEVIVVTSVATGMGRRLMRKHGRMNMTMAEKMTSSNDLTDLTEGVQDVCCDSNSNLQAVTGDAVAETASLMVTASRDQARKLQSLSYDERQTILSTSKTPKRMERHRHSFEG
jgi:hypothetical protein